MEVDEITCYQYDMIKKNGDSSILGVENHLELWEELNYEIVAIVGLSQEYREWMENMRKAIIYLDKYLDGDVSAINFWKAHKVEADHILSTITENTDNNVNERLKYSVVSKFMGQRIDKKTMPVLEFFSMIELMKIEAKEIEKIKQR